MNSGGSTATCQTCGKAFTSAFLPDAADIARLDEILRSNAVAPETPSLQRMVSAGPIELGRYDSEIERLHKELDRLTSERHTLASYADRCRSVFAPIRRIPTELLAEIFEMCSAAVLIQLSGGTTPHEEPASLSMRHLLQLSQVSSLWHSIVINTPKLWSTILVDTCSWDECTVPPEVLLSLLQSSLNRGGNHPLTIEVISIPPHEELVLELLSRHASRWRDVFFAGADIESAKYLTAAKGNLGQLQTLDLSVNWPGVDILQVAPQLTDVTFRGEVAGVPNLPWAQIRRFVYVGEDWASQANCLSLLMRATNVETASFAMDLTAVSVEDPWQSVSSNLKSVILELADNPIHAKETVCRVLDTLTFPSLQSFSFWARTATGVAPVLPSQHFMTFADRSSFHIHLTRLQICAIITDKELLRCLSVLPQLRDLTVSDCTSPEEHTVITDALLQGLMDDTSLLVPRLNFLHLTSLLGFADSIYVDLLLTRAHGIAYFKAELWWLPARQREASSDMLNQLANLVSNRSLLFDFESGPRDRGFPFHCYQLLD
ncbi:hypothetical protein MVEN_00672200 [Mycena venus]|uniref:F-box domain-containing protein n=1 Tax=Mycena venus TaxID=2733690 RepID=A0A8H6YQZ1_9AGAR|nr:hypothetical protein MVEN_00672200 [Mycena venus]